MRRADPARARRLDPRGKAVKEIDANPAAYSGRGEANAGKIMGIVGTCLLVLVLLGVVALIIIGVNGGFDDDTYNDPYYSDTFIGGLASTFRARSRRAPAR